MWWLLTAKYGDKFRKKTRIRLNRGVISRDQSLYNELRLLRRREENGIMPKLPKLKIRNPLAEPSEDLCEVEQAKSRYFDHPLEDTLFLVEGEAINTYEELVEIASRDDYKDKEFLQVELLPSLIGGG